MTMRPPPEAFDASEISGETFDLLDCASSELNKVVYSIAETFARQSGRLNSRGVIDIQAADVQKAAETILSAIRHSESVPLEGVAEAIKAYNHVFRRYNLPLRTR